MTHFDRKNGSVQYPYQKYTRDVITIFKSINTRCFSWRISAYVYAVILLFLPDPILNMKMLMRAGVVAQTNIV